MTIYVDYVLLLNFLFDLILLISIALILKRRISIIRIVISALVGSISVFILFIPIGSIIMFVLKMVTGLIMIILCFKFKNLKYTLNNFFYLITNSILLGGILYFIDTTTNTTTSGLSFAYSNNHLNTIFLFALGGISLLVYAKQNKKAINKANYYQVDLYMNHHKYQYTGFLDTGNKLYDPYFHKPILLIYDPTLLFDTRIYVPFKTLNNSGIIECTRIDKIYIHGVGFRKNVLLGRAFDKFNIDGVDIILHEDLMEG